MPVLSATENQSQSLVAELDVRIKLLFCLGASVLVIFLDSPEALIFLAIASTLYVLNLKRYTMMAICYTAMIFMWLMSIGFMAIMHLLSPKIPVLEASKMMVPFLRTGIMLNTVLGLALSSRIRILLTALKNLRLPVWLYIPAAVMIRFIPTFIRDVRQIHETMRIRGYSLNPLFIIRRPLLSVRLMAAPVLFRALRSADDLGIAAELKGLTTDSALQNYKPDPFSPADKAALAVFTGIIIIGCIIQSIYGSAAPGFHP